MHEYSLVRALLEQVETLMHEHDADQVVSIRVRVGEFSGVEPELFRSAYDLFVDTTLACGAQLHMETTPLECRCDDCGHEFAVEQFCFQRPQCESRSLTILRGEELVLESVTMEQAEEYHEPANCFCKT